MKIKVGQKVLIKKSLKAREALSDFYIGETFEALVGRVARVREVTEFNGMPAVLLSFRGRRNPDLHPDYLYPISAFRSA